MLWKDYYYAIFYKIFLHYCRFFVETVVYLTLFLTPWDSKPPGQKFAEILLVSSMSLDVLTEISIEFIQLKNEGFQQYFNDFWNLVDWL